MIQVSCPTCKKLVQKQATNEPSYFPFCSRRCKLIDLGRWHDEEYGIEAVEQDEPGPESESP